MKYAFFILNLLFPILLFAQIGLKTGDKAPDFSAADQNGKTINLQSELRKSKAVVLFFYRGEWCPFCNKHIQQLQDSLQLLKQKGATVIGVSPETAQGLKKTSAKTGATFPILSDRENRIMKAYQVDYVMEPGLVTQYKTYGIDLSKANGNDKNMLPVPATYIIGKDGTISFVHFDKDYKKRASAKTLLSHL
ncbi:MAG: AhpC/TSA family protein [Mucilaginibacter polytrichastri]|nr:AhpC/TSA family protein [Mucilaginibacter polytrichastri]